MENHFMENQSMLRCERCGSHNVQVQLLNQIDLVKKGHSAIWWILVGWWFVLIKWLFLYGLLQIFIIPLKLLMPKKYKTINRVEKYFVCNNCGHSWK